MRTIDERTNGPICDRCDWPMIIQIGATPGIVKNPAVPRRHS